MSATKKIVVCAILTALGIVLGYIENLFPQIIPLYGLKIGFSNLVVIYALYEFSIKYAISIGVAKSVLSGITFSGLPDDDTKNLRVFIFSSEIPISLQKRSIS